MHIKNLFLVTLVIILSSCKTNLDNYYKEVLKQKIVTDALEITYPLTESIFPPDFYPPTFKWEVDSKKEMNFLFILCNSEGTILHRNELNTTSYQLNETNWKSIIKENTELYCYILAKEKKLFGGRQLANKVHFNISSDSVGASIFYRAVPLPFSYAIKHVDEIKWYMGAVSEKQPKVLLENIPVCANCHSFNASGSHLAMDVDYANDKGSYAIAMAKDTCRLSLENIITWSDYKRNDGDETFGLLSQISPDGENVVSTVKDRSVFVPVDDNLSYSQLFFPIKGILANYNRKTKKYSDLKGANNEDYVQSNPSWSANGKQLFFSRAKRYRKTAIENSKSVLLDIDDVQEFISGKQEFKFDIYKLEYNQGNGSEAIPIKGASNNNKSNFFARCSPDGKWMVFCQSENFMLLQPDSKLYIKPVDGDSVRLMNCNTNNMNSWHSWSPNSKWLVFSSKQGGAYTQLYLTHIDENGNDSRAILLENLQIENRATNIPEFFPANAAHLQKITDNFSQSAPFYSRMAELNINKQQYKNALDNIDKALSIDSAYLEAYLLKIKTNLLLHQKGLIKIDAVIQIASQLTSKLKNTESNLIEKASFYYLIGEYQKSMQLAGKLVSLNKRNYKAQELIKSNLIALNNYKALHDHYSKMKAVFPDKAREIDYLNTMAFQKEGDIQTAVKQITSLIKKYPNDAVYHSARAGIYMEQKNATGAISDMEIAISLDPKNFMLYQSRGAMYLDINMKFEAENDLKQAIKLISSNKEINNGNPNLLLSRADLYKKLNQRNNAQLDYETILNYWPENYLALKNLGEISIRAQQWDNAFRYYRNVYTNYHPEIDVINNLALICLQKGQNELALKYFSEALKLDASNPDILFNRARLYLNGGKKAQARNDLQLLKSTLSKNNANPKLLVQVQKMLQSI